MEVVWPSEAIVKAGGHIQSVTIVGTALEDVYLKLVREGGGS